LLQSLSMVRMLAGGTWYFPWSSLVTCAEITALNQYWTG